MTTSGTLRLPRRLFAAAAALALAATALIATAGPASAHDQLIGSTPAADATVEGLPAELVLTFSAVISADAGASEVQVTDAAGTDIAGVPVADGTALTVPLEQDASGVLAVLWKVVSSDGHPISGEFSFTVTAPAAPTESPTPTASPTPTESATPTETAAPTATPTPEPAADDSDAGATGWIIAGVLLLIALAGAVAYLLISRARRRKALAGRSAQGADTGSETPSER